jgi:hypothetical protein
MLGSNYLGAFYLGESYDELPPPVVDWGGYNPYNPYDPQLPYFINELSQNTLFNTTGQILQLGQYDSKREGMGQ